MLCLERTWLPATRVKACCHAARLPHPLLSWCASAMACIFPNSCCKPKRVYFEHLAETLQSRQNSPSRGKTIWLAALHTLHACVLLDVEDLKCHDHVEVGKLSAHGFLAQFHTSCHDTQGRLLGVRKAMVAQKLRVPICESNQRA